MQHNTDPRGHDNASEVERGAYNQAFSELGLEWYWDSRTYESLKTCAGNKHCVQAYDSGFLAEAIESVRRRLSGGAPH